MVGKLFSLPFSLKTLSANGSVVVLNRVGINMTLQKAEMIYRQERYEVTWNPADIYYQCGWPIRNKLAETKDPTYIFDVRKSESWTLEVLLVGETNQTVYINKE